MNHSKIIRGAFALPFLLVGSAALAQGAQQPSGTQGSQTESEQMRQQQPLRGSQAGRTGEPTGTRQMQQPAEQQPQRGMEEPTQQPQMQRQQQQAMGEGASFQNVDKNGDGEITRSEVREATQSVVSKWDHDQDGKVSQLEALGAIAKNVDRSGDESIDEQEFQAVQQQWMPQGATATFAEWDGNGDGKLTYLEFADGLVESEVARKFDRNRDGQVSERELQNGLFATLDKDGNNRLSQEEWPIS